MALIFSDTFTEDVNTTLASHAPDTGTSWTRLIGFGIGTPTLTASGTSNRVIGAGGSLSNGVIYTADTTYSTANYEVSCVMSVGDTADDKSHLLARIQDSDDFYAVQFNTQDGGAFDSDGNFLYKVVAGTATQLGTNIGTITDGQTVLLGCNGSTIYVKVNGVEVESVTDTSHAAAGKAGIAMGTTYISGADMSSQALDDFQVNTLSSATVVKDVIGCGIIPFSR